MLTSQERRLRALLRVLAIAFALAILAYLLPALGVFGATLKQGFTQLPFVTNSVVKIGVLAMLALFASSDVRGYRVLTKMLIVGHLISELAMAAVLIWGNTATLMPLPALLGGDTLVRNLIIGAMVLDGVILVLLITFYAAAERARYGLEYLSPTQFRTLSALADVVVMGADEKLSADDVAYNTDRYLGGFHAQSKWLSRVVLTAMQYYPLLTLRAPFSHLPPADRLEFLERRFYRAITLRLTPPFVRTLIQAAIRMAKQLCYLGYYGDARTFDEVGYTPYSQRGRSTRRVVSPTLDVLRPKDLRKETYDGEIVIIGSGPAGAVLAYNLVEQGHDVLMLERGPHLDPTEFTEDEVHMLSNLYRDGAFQLSRDFRFQVLQGSCVGGTSVINNAVCFRAPGPVIDRWNSELNARIDDAQLWSSFAAVEDLVRVQKQHDIPLNPGADVFTRGIRQLGYDQPPFDYDVVSANIEGCLGCGYCNIGCAYGRKLSMLDTVLPRAQQNARGSLRIISECEVLRLKGRGSRITAAECRLSDGRRIDVRARTFVVAAGAISSSLLLQRSHIGGRNVGRRVSFNVGSPVHAVCADIINAYDGLQISHYLSVAPARGFIIETWYNPPLAQALVMPGWFADHFYNMRRYNRMTAVGVLVGSEANAVVKPAGLTGREITFEPTKDDLRKVLDGVVLAGDVFLAAGAQPVMPATFEYREYHTQEQLRDIYRQVKDPSDITLGTGHPMGGNAISDDPGSGVVDARFNVYGYANLFVCDASVFPTSLGVNPQLTVMALAHYAAPFISESVPKEAAASAFAMAGGQ
jgi:choline dehydrogenase-like flavoprotein